MRAISARVTWNPRDGCRWKNTLGGHDVSPCRPRPRTKDLEAHVRENLARLPRFQKAKMPRLGPEMLTCWKAEWFNMRNGASALTRSPRYFR